VKLSYLLIDIRVKEKLLEKEMGLNSMVKALLSSRNTNKIQSLTKTQKT